MLAGQAVAYRVLTSLSSFFRSELQGYREPVWRPAVDIYRSSRGWLVKVDLAGVRPQDLDVEARGCRLVIRGLRRDWSVAEEGQAYSMEIAYDRFERIVELPEFEAIERTVIDYHDGMLLIRIETRSKGG